MTKIAIVGSREYPRLGDVIEYLEKVKKVINRFELITGGAQGVDRAAEDWALSWGMNVEVIRPINPANKIDYLFRNVEIISKADFIAIFWDGKSKGTKFVIDYCRARGKLCKIIKNES